MALSKRMKEILVILAQCLEGISRYNLVYAIEKDNWIEKTRQSNFLGRIPLDSVRVSYDRTLSKLIEMNLIDGFYPEDIPTMSFYYGTLMGGRAYRLTEKGKRVANEVIDKALKESARLNQLILNGLDSS
jgi:hypothetical protein